MLQTWVGEEGGKWGGWRRMRAETMHRIWVILHWLSLQLFLARQTAEQFSFTSEHCIHAHAKFLFRKQLAWLCPKEEAEKTEQKTKAKHSDAKVARS